MNTYTPVLTEQGQNKIQNEYTSLKNRYLEISTELRELGLDRLDDMFTTSTKKVEQLFLEDKLKKVQQIIDRMKVVSNARSKKFADVGSKVTYRQCENRYTITLVDPLETDPSIGFISINSPLGKALNQRKVNETITVVAPRSTYEVKLLKIS